MRRTGLRRAGVVVRERPFHWALTRRGPAHAGTCRDSSEPTTLGQDARRACEVVQSDEALKTGAAVTGPPSRMKVATPPIAHAVATPTPAETAPVSAPSSVRART